MTTAALERFASVAEEHHCSGAESNPAFGFWIYIMSDCILFATLFATYVVLSHNYAGGPTGKDLFDLKATLAETAFLLFSSVTFGFAMLSMHKHKPAGVIAWLMVTSLFGLGFLGLEVHEFSQMIMAGNGPDRSGFLTGFFSLVATHGLHVTTGMIWMTVMMVQVMTKGLTGRVQSRMMRLSMFWHFLDVVWIGVFSVVYLMGVM